MRPLSVSLRKGGSGWREMGAASSGGLRNQSGFQEDLVGGDLANAEWVEQVGEEASKEVGSGQRPDL